jgi:hypothetical protein
VVACLASRRYWSCCLLASALPWLTLWAIQRQLQDAQRRVWVARAAVLLLILLILAADRATRPLQKDSRLLLACSTCPSHLLFHCLGQAALAPSMMTQTPPQRHVRVSSIRRACTASRLGTPSVTTFVTV